MSSDPKRLRLSWQPIHSDARVSPADLVRIGSDTVVELADPLSMIVARPNGDRIDVSAMSGLAR